VIVRVACLGAGDPVRTPPHRGPTWRLVVAASCTSATNAFQTCNRSQRPGIPYLLSSPCRGRCPSIASVVVQPRIAST